jgi:hypothetical protein
MWRAFRTAILTWMIGAKALLAQAGTPDPRTRADLLRQLADAQRAAAASPTDQTAALAHGKLLYQAGEFWRARDLLRPIAEPATAPDEAVELAARLEFLTGRYDAADRLYDRLIASRAGNPSGQVMANVGKMFSLYQRDRFADIATLGFPPAVQLPNVTLAKTFDQPPYRLEWPTADKVTEVRFHALDPLPQFPIEVNGVAVNVFLDTGGDVLIIDDEVAKALGVIQVASVKGAFGGGLEATIGFGKVDRITIGGVTIHQVPVMVMATKRFTFDPNYPIGGIVGTALMRQFLATVDYRGRTLVLRDRSAASAETVRRELAGNLAAEVPFVLDATHLMHARGGLDDKEGLTFFIDSGLGMDAIGSFPVQTLKYAGIPIPEMKVPEGGVGGGGGKFASGFFPIRSATLGSLRQAGIRGETGARPPSSYWERGFIADGLLSHGFLKQYGSWTIDFDSMTYLFER